jgi:YfiH family protein
MSKYNLSNLLWVQEGPSYLQFPELSKHPGISHGVFTRLGGVSEPPYDTLNTSYSVGDRADDVAENLGIIKKTMSMAHLAFMNQSHGIDIAVFRRSGDSMFHEPPDADAMITSIPGLGLMVKQADCQAVILFDPGKKVVANVHCGWRGNVRNILGMVVRRMEDAFGCTGADLLAAIGPSLGPCCAEFVTHQDLFPEDFKRFMVRENWFDLWAISRRQLEEAGLKSENIALAEVCTRCRRDLFYSYRGEGKTGRFGTVVMLV